MLRKFAFLGLGILFGFTLSRVGASDYNLIFNMFAGIDFKLALVMGSAIIIAALFMKIIALNGYKGFQGRKIDIHKKPFNQYTIWGGLIFGCGWAISGACPGTVLAQLGEGKLLAIFTILGALLGTYVYALIAEKNTNLK